MLKCNKENAYYIGLIPTLHGDIEKFKSKADFDISFLSWEKVEKFCEEKNLEKVIEIFKHNKGQIY